MKFSLKILLLTVLVFLGAADLYAQQVIVLDPVSDYEFSVQDGLFSIPIGATFMESWQQSSSQYQLAVSGLPSFLKLTIQKQQFRINGKLDLKAQPVPGTYNISITARDTLYGATSSATMKLRIVNGVPNRPIILDPIEQIKVLKTGQSYSLSLSATDEDPEYLSLTVTGTGENGLGDVDYIQEPPTPGRAAGMLLMQMARPGELKINVVAKDERSYQNPGESSNKTAAELRFLVVN
jgi:hypothetical protein